MAGFDPTNFNDLADFAGVIQRGEITKELQAQRKAAALRDKLPRCPVCGGQLEGKYRKCMHCQSDLVWVEDIPCEPKDANSVRQRVARQAEEQREAQKRLVAARQELIRKEKEEELQKSRRTAAVKEATSPLATISTLVAFAFGALVPRLIGFYFPFAEMIAGERDAFGNVPAEVTFVYATFGIMAGLVLAAISAKSFSDHAEKVADERERTQRLMDAHRESARQQETARLKGRR